jgi:hypothetical protein
MVAEELKAYNDLDFACSFDGKIPANVAEQKMQRTRMNLKLIMSPRTGAICSLTIVRILQDIPRKGG